MGRIARKIKTTVFKVFNIRFRKCVLFETPRIYFKKKTKIGRGTSINDAVFIHGAGGVEIGDNCVLSHGVTILSTGLNIEDWCLLEASKSHIDEKVTIGNNVWLCANTTICPGVTIGDNVVIAAGAVVVSDCESGFLYGGVPAKKIRSLK